jgi:hypothetical protein
MTTQNRLVGVEVAHTAASGVSWAAIIAGAVVAAAVSLILLSLGSGLGFSVISPWAYSGVSATTFSIGAAIWLIVVHAVGSAGGGYLAGRLRTRWLGIHSDEVYFRDTAHGFLVWALSAVISASILASAAAALVGTGIQAGALTGAAAIANNQAAPARADGSYTVDLLFRSDRPGTDVAGDQATRAEVGRILASNVKGDLSDADRAYVARLVAARTGLSEADAQKRVDEVVTQAREAANRARKAAAYVSLWSFIALLAGAFCASLAATCGGKHRDNVATVAVVDTGVTRTV